MKIVGGDSKRRFLLRDTTTHTHTHKVGNLYINFWAILLAISDSRNGMEKVQ